MKIFAVALGLAALCGTAFAGDRGVVVKQAECANGVCNAVILAPARVVRVPVVVAPVVVAPAVKVEAKKAACCETETALLVRKVHRPLLRLRAGRGCDCGCN